MSSEEKQKKVAIVGAGLSGLAAAFELKSCGVDFRLFEKSRGVSGRAASRVKNGCIYDFGANYLKFKSETVRELLFERLPTGDFAEINGDVWLLSKDGATRPGDASLNQERKWTHKKGIKGIGKLLSEGFQENCEFQSRVSDLDRRGGSWWLFLEATKCWEGPFDALFLSPPTPQTHALLNQKRELFGSVLEELSEVRYHQQLSFVFGFGERLRMDRSFHALLGDEESEMIAWLSFEEDKPGHVPEDKTVLVVQAKPEWSRVHFEDNEEELKQAMLQEVEKALKHSLPNVEFFDLQRWRYSLPANAVPGSVLSALEEQNVFLLGDGLSGKGRMSNALESGLLLARRWLNGKAL